MDIRAKRDKRHDHHTGRNDGPNPNKTFKSRFRPGNKFGKAQVPGSRKGVSFVLSGN